MYNPREAPSPKKAPEPRTGAGGEANPRYVHLVTRLRNRQITMEEATELFGIMQAMLRASETARLMATASGPIPPPPPGTTISVSPAGTPVSVRSAPASSDDFLLMGILAMGAGAGLLAALARRISEAPPAPPAAPDPPRRGGRPS